jgi:hypothetical protein
MPVVFKERPAKSVVFVATIRASGAPPPNTIETGDDVKLYADAIEVFAKVTSKITDSEFKGKVIGANARGAKAPPELASGAEIVFEMKHIFTCSKRAR